MRFRDAKQRATVCHVLLKLVRMERFFPLPGDVGEYRPTNDAENEYLRILSNESVLSSGEKTMLLFMFYIWNDRGDPKVRDLEQLEHLLVGAIGHLIHDASSKNPVMVDQWIDRWKDVDAAAEYFAS